MSNVQPTIVQAISRSASATSDVTGAATFTFEAIPVGQQWTGSLQCPQAPYTAQHTAESNGDLLGAFIAGNNFGPVYVGSNGRIVVNSVGLVPLTAYQLTFTGYVTTSGPTEPVFPTAYADTVIATNQGGLQHIRIAGSLGAQILPAPPAGFAYRVHSVSYLYTAVAPAPSAGYFEVYDGSPSQGVIYIDTWLSGQYAMGTFLLNGLLVPYSILFTASLTCVPILQYDVIQI